MRPFTGKSMALVMAGFFTAFVAANMTLAYHASRSWTGLVVPNSYVASQSFEARSAEIAEQRASGWRVAVAYDDGVLALDLAGAQGAPLQGVSARAELGRPTHEGEDRPLDLIRTERGFEARGPLATGPWRLKLAIEGPAGERWIETKRFTVFRDG